MRILRPGVAGVAILLALMAVLVSGCELREGDPHEYGHASGLEMGAR